MEKAKQPLRSFQHWAAAIKRQQNSNSLLGITSWIGPNHIEPATRGIPPKIVDSPALWDLQHVPPLALKAVLWLTHELTKIKGWNFNHQAGNYISNALFSVQTSILSSFSVQHKVTADQGRVWDKVDVFPEPITSWKAMAFGVHILKLERRWKCPEEEKKSKETWEWKTGSPGTSPWKMKTTTTKKTDTTELSLTSVPFSGLKNLVFLSKYYNPIWKPSLCSISI